MPWDELKQRLTGLGVPYTENAPHWQITAAVGTFRAHPAFLDALSAGEAKDLLLGGARDAAPLIGRFRLVLDGHLEAIDDARAQLGITDGRYGNLSEQIPLLQYADAGKDLPQWWQAGVRAEATEFAGEHNPASVQAFINLHGSYLYALRALQAGGDEPAAADRPEAIRTVYAEGRAAAEHTAPGRPTLGTQAAWRSHQPDFAGMLQKSADRLNFGSVEALVAHALKHPRKDQPLTRKPNAAKNLIDAYLKAARKQIEQAADISSALAQLGATRTYYYGPPGERAMVAVDETGAAWITTYFAPGGI
ncbi:hypothetical protein [Streptomyces sp. NPDC020298]|uniref:hypothetical protein n=1 Tax=unclassified Streptomyces TaxID=2593676 RepID=UPI0033FF30D2